MNTFAKEHFDQPINRWGTHSAKWDLLAAPLGEDAFSLSVADMEFQTAPIVADAVIEAAEHKTYGYTEVFDDYAAAAANWQWTRHGWDVLPENIHFFPRIVQCVSALLNFVLPQKLGRPPRVVTLSPAYGPILEVVQLSGAALSRVELSDTTACACIDWESLDTALADADLLLWCDPHNPTGRIWNRDEQNQLAELLRKHTHVLVLCDDIHADFQRPHSHAYSPLAAQSPDLWESGRIIQCASPGKTFTTAGLEAAAIMVKGPLGCELEEAKRRAGLHNPNYFAIPATIAAWNDGHQWVDELNTYLDENIRIAQTILNSELPQALYSDPDGTYLLWIDASAYVDDEVALQRVCRRAHVAVTPGTDFGEQYSRYFRINVALPTLQLKEAVNRLCLELRAERSVAASNNEQ